MVSDDLKFLRVGLAVVACVLVAGAVVLRLGRRESVPERIPQDHRAGFDSFEDRILAEQELAALRDESNTFDIAALGLDGRYQTAPLHDTTRSMLYKEQNFPMVEQRLTAERHACKSPLDFLRYSQHIDEICGYTSQVELVNMLHTLNTWIETRPDSYHARMIRGCLGHEYYWIFNGARPSRENLDAGWIDADTFLQQSRTDLTLAFELNRKDPEIPRWRLKVAGALDEEQAVLDSFLQDALSICPQHLASYIAWFDSTLRHQRGPLSSADMAVADANEGIETFPLLALVSWHYQMLLPVEGNPIEVMDNYARRKKVLAPEALAAFEAQIALNPGDFHLMAAAAYHGTIAERWGRATYWFQQIGDVFPAGGEFANLADYNRARARAYRMYAAEEKARGTQLEAELLTEAESLLPEAAVQSRSVD